MSDSETFQLAAFMVAVGFGWIWGFYVGRRYERIIQTANDKAE